MRVWIFYALWVTSNGQHLWAGPFDSERVAQAHLDATLECTGKLVVRRSVEWSDR